MRIGLVLWPCIVFVGAALAALTLIPDPPAPADLVGCRSLCAQELPGTPLHLLVAGLGTYLWVAACRRRESRPKGVQALDNIAEQQRESG